MDAGSLLGCSQSLPRSFKLTGKVDQAHHSSTLIIVLVQENTFQAIVATDSNSTYTIFTYKCGLMEWGSFGTIGFTAAGNPFYNNNPSSNEIACTNTPESDWNNVVYLLSDNNPEIPPPSMCSFFYMHAILHSAL